MVRVRHIVHRILFFERTILHDYWYYIHCYMYCFPCAKPFKNLFLDLGLSKQVQDICALCRRSWTRFAARSTRCMRSSARGKHDLSAWNSAYINNQFTDLKTNILSFKKDPRHGCPPPSSFPPPCELFKVSFMVGEKEGLASGQSIGFQLPLQDPSRIFRD